MGVFLYLASVYRLANLLFLPTISQHRQVERRLRAARPVKAQAATSCRLACISSTSCTSQRRRDPHPVGLLYLVRNL